ncbi:MAG: hypothetical protein WD492_16125 [Alkalispirochaeta sp.]
MKLLFDTHSFLWWTTAPERLPARARQAFADAKAELILSVASAADHVLPHRSPGPARALAS